MAAAQPQGLRSTLARRAPAEARAVTVLAESEAEAEDEVSEDEYGDDAEGKCAKPFKQCGGESWGGKTCCPEGCACIEQNPYYSTCETPSGDGICDLVKAKMRAADLRANADPLTQAFQDKAAVYEEKHQDFMELKAKYEKAHAEAVKSLHAALAAKEAFAKRNASSEAATKEMRRVEKEKDAAVMWWDTVANEHNADCGDYNGNCKASRCCQHGCGCVEMNDYYSQCKGPCGVEMARRTSKRHAAAATGSEAKDTVEDAKAASEAADSAAASARSVFKRANFTYAEAHEAYMEKHKLKVEAKARMDHAETLAAEAKREREKAHKSIGKAEQDAAAWEKVAAVAEAV